MYELIISKFELGSIKITDYCRHIVSTHIPREHEKIEGIKIEIEDDEDNLNEYSLDVEVRDVRYRLFQDDSVMVVVYGEVINTKME